MVTVTSIRHITTAKPFSQIAWIDDDNKPGSKLVPGHVTPDEAQSIAEAYALG